MLLNITLPEPGATAPRRYHCERCNGTTHSHATNNHRQIADTRLSEIQQRRFKCTRCGKTFPSYPEGISRGAQRTNRVKALGVLFYVLGLSYRQAASVVKALAQKTCPSTLYNDVQRAGACAEELHCRAEGKVRIIGVDGTGQQMKGSNRGVVFAVDHDEQLLLQVEVMEETDERRIRRFLKKLSKEYGMKILVTDEHRSYQGGAKGLDLEHRFCETHWKKAKVKRARGLRERAKRRGWRRATDDLEELARKVRNWPDGNEEDIKKLWEGYVKYRAPSPGKRWSFGYEIRLLMQDVLENWNRVGPTNNATERLIGLLLKMRSKVMRGFVKPENIKKFVYLSGFLWAHRDACDVSPLFN